MSTGVESSRPTLGSLLKLSQIREGQPEVIVGTNELDRRIRWAHVSETPDVGVMLAGGELILTTGQLLNSPSDQQAFVQELVRAGVVAVMLGMGRAFDTVPAPLVAACRRGGIVLVALWRPIAFITITEAVQTECLDRSSARALLAESVRAHLNAAAQDEAPMQATVTEISALANCPVVVESADRKVLLSAGGRGLGEVLRDWTRLSQFISRGAYGATTTHVTNDGVVATQLRVGRRVWGRLILFAHSVSTDRAATVAELGAAALEMQHLTAIRRGGWEREAATELFTDLLSNAHDSEVLALRARAAGFSTRNSSITPVILRISHSARAIGADAAGVADRISSVARSSDVAVLLGPIEAETVTLLCSASSDDDPKDPVDRFVMQLRKRPDLGVMSAAAGPAVLSTHLLRPSLHEARRVLASGSNMSPVARLADLRLDGLMHMLADDDYLQAFTDRELGPLLDEPELLELLASFIDHDLNKAATADALFMSRQTVYRRLSKIESKLGTDLASVSSMATLYVALRAYRVRGKSQ